MKYIFGLILFLNLSCSTMKKEAAAPSCNENEQFKREFFFNINNVKKLITKNQNLEFKNSLKFISKYVPVSFEAMANYSHTYPVEVFNSDYKNWMKWYKENKCNNIQFK